MKRITPLYRAVTAATAALSLVLTSMGVAHAAEVSKPHTVLIPDTSVASLSNGNNAQLDASEIEESFSQAVNNHQPGKTESIKKLAIAANQLSNLQEEKNTESPAVINQEKPIKPVVFIEDAHVINATQGESVHVSSKDNLEFFHKVTSSEEQVIAILKSRESSHEQKYDLALPENMSLKLQNDGSVAILETVTEDVVLPGESERVETAVENIVGKNEVTFEDIDKLSEDQILKLAEIPDEATDRKVSTEIVGMVEKPWAIDANGTPLETHFKVNGDQLTQVIATDENTTYPVVADPKIGWWLWKAAKCTVGVASLAAFGPAKIAFVSSKIYKVLKFGKTVQLKNAFRSWLRLGGTNKARFGVIINQVKVFANTVKSIKNIKRAYRKSKSYKSGANSLNFLKYGGSVVADIIGIKTCVYMAKQAF